MSLAATLKRARKAVKNATKGLTDKVNELYIHKETDQFNNKPDGALIIVLKDLDSLQDSSEPLTANQI